MTRMMVDVLYLVALMGSLLIAWYFFRAEDGVLRLTMIGGFGAAAIHYAFLLPLALGWEGSDLLWFLSLLPVTAFILFMLGYMIRIGMMEE